MHAGWKIFWLFAAIFAAALGLERTFVPNVVPIAFADEPQPLWMVETAFILRALELRTRRPSHWTKIWPSWCAICARWRPIHRSARPRSKT